MRGLLMSMVSNPIDALLKGNYIGILVWAIGLGFALRHGNETTKNLINDMSNAFRRLSSRRLFFHRCWRVIVVITPYQRQY